MLQKYLCSICKMREFVISELRLMFSLMDRVPDGITPMLHDLEAYIVSQGLADMMAAAETITTVNHIAITL